jgi:UDP-N-acetylglucosamine 2-epimerase (non-hydrolysing)
VDAGGRIVGWSATEPPVVLCASPLRADDVARAVSAALATTRPDVVLVAGDGEEALAATLAAARAGVPIARLGAGLRCGDRSSEREINRIAIDELATRLYTDSEYADEQLCAEGFDEARILSAGTTVPEAVERWRPEALQLAMWTRAGLDRRGYILASLNRRESFADVATLAKALTELGQRYPVVLCIEPRRRVALEAGGSLKPLLETGAIISEPLDYLEFLSLEAGAGAVLTDSGGVQEESSVLGVDCFTLANRSECSLTLTHGTNVLLGEHPAAIEHVRPGIEGGVVEPLPLWTADAGRRIATDLQCAPWGHR